MQERKLFYSALTPQRTNPPWIHKMFALRAAATTDEISNETLCLCVHVYCTMPAPNRINEWNTLSQPFCLCLIYILSRDVCVCVQICMRLCVCLCILPSSYVLWGNSVCSSCEASCVARTHKCGRSRAFSEYVDQLQRWRCGDGSDLNEAVSQCALALLVNSSSWATHTHNIHVVALLLTWCRRNCDCHHHCCWDAIYNGRANTNTQQHRQQQQTRQFCYVLFVFAKGTQNNTHITQPVHRHTNTHRNTCKHATRRLDSRVRCVYIARAQSMMLFNWFYLCTNIIQRFVPATTMFMCIYVCYFLTL